MFILSIIPFVKIPFPAPQTLDYFSSQEAGIGAIAQIKISSRKMLGIVIASEPVSNRKQDIKKSAYKLKPVDKILTPYPVFDKKHLELLLWISAYYYSPLGLIAKTFSPQIFSKPTEKFIKELSALSESSMPYTQNIRAIIPHKPVLYWNSNEEEKIKYYSKKIRHALKEKKTVLFLVPEIYKLDYFKEKISSLKSAAVITSRLSKNIQFEIWKKSANGGLDLIIGTRAALAIYIKNLGLIIIDTEDSDYYKSFDQQPYINARDVAIKLANLAGAEIILGTSLPSMESFYKTKEGKYEIIKSKVKSQKSKVTVIDMRKELKGGNYSIFSREIQEKLKAAILNNKQSVLFINRKGLATGLLCRDCGHVIKCPNCDVPLVYYQLPDDTLKPTASFRSSPIQIGERRRKTYNLVCHHCGQRKNAPSVCPKCQSYRIKFIGSGTQRVGSELDKFSAQSSIKLESVIMDNDNVKTWQEQEQIFKKFTDKKYNVLIGTQLMLKPELLKKVEFAAIVTIDPILSVPDYRMGERILRVMDRLNRISMSEIILQTYIPDSPIFKNILDSFVSNNKNAVPNTFFEKELEMRQILSFPPFSQIIKLTYSHANPQKAEAEAKVLHNKIELQLAKYKIQNAKYKILGPAPAFIPREKNRYIWQIMIKSKLKDLSLRNKLLRVVPSDWKVDVDPIEIL